MIYSNESEQAVLACLILDNNKINLVIRLLKPDDFYNKAHSDLYKTILDLYNNNTPADLVTLSDKGFDIEYLSKIIEKITSPESIIHYAQIVRGKAIRRKYVDIGQEIQQLAISGEYENITEFRNDIMQKVDFEVIDRRNKKDIASLICEAVTTIERRYEGLEETGLQYGLKWLDNWTGGAKNNELSILAARPSVGKTALSIQIALNIASKQKHVAIFSLEMGEEQLIDRMICNVSGVSLTKIRTGNEISQDDWTKITQASSIISAMKINIFDDIYKTEEIRSECRTLKNKKQLDYIIIDYLQLCETGKKSGNEAERISNLTRQFKRLNQELKVPILLLCQLNRENEKDNRKPLLTDLRGSGSIEQDADNVFFLYDPNSGDYEKDGNKEEIQLIIAKQRSGERDKFTSKEIKFIKATQRWINVKI